MSRYFFYPVVLTMLINTIFYIPRIMIEERFNGAFMGILISIPIGSLMAYLFVNAMSKFPGLGLPEILERNLVTALRIPILSFLSVMWFIAGAIIIVSFSLITERYVNPEISKSLLLLFSVVVICWSSTRTSLAIINVLEIGLLLSIPFIMFISYKAMSHEMLDWDAIWTMSDYILRVPPWHTVSAATYLFTGYINLVLYNRFFKDTRVKHLWIIPIVGTLIFFTTIFLPIGMQGTQAVEEYIYVWISTADAIRMEYGFIERVLFLFLFLYIGLALLFVTMTWNVGLTLLRSCFRTLNHNKKRMAIFNWTVCGMMGGITLVFGAIVNEKQLIFISKQWFNIRFPIEILLVTLVVIISRRKNHA
ncbi:MULTISPECIES: GerAB/ArcD/ProY family transporter [unclassified Paenibacillus]|uniref:GerAB/ArcD/ProY family transporter n=1 Tax=unclassified Paenibacillus TaxID=185978 RepID=UPI001AE51230|nr:MULTISPECIES: GerAB/ArcD/ProY family transporter [unclassified Paenibacillus]MBP1154181.1 uncharacterized PurR-regulated membrane protein YhhQ (DUF165 family) [Paenibacillus sp. PvP091]MBP1170434.1 uncharacterized PurR-regulated membrane protein YhhQ (DUF165 family) [Paenibacillus sp. PvR098]MBP2441462.1 uncharacterized PurR-regulated membrane protein YhhQ (DUF165 family) [Paenibacillus sp. PvP052]